MNDKIIVTNLGALKKKYGANGLAKIRVAVKALISADKVRGLQTRLIALDRASDMKKVHGSRVSAADNCQQNKKAIDAIYATLRPDYLLIRRLPDATWLSGKYLIDANIRPILLARMVFRKATRARHHLRARKRGAAS